MINTIITVGWEYIFGAIKYMKYSSEKERIGVCNRIKKWEYNSSSNEHCNAMKHDSIIISWNDFLKIIPPKQMLTLNPSRGNPTGKLCNIRRCLFKIIWYTFFVPTLSKIKRLSFTHMTMNLIFYISSFLNVW